MQTEDPFDQEEYIPSPSEANAELFRTKLSELMGKVNWNTMGTNEKCAAMVRALMDASKLCGKLSTPPIKMSVACKSIAWLRARCMAIESKVWQLRMMKPVLGFENNLAGQALAAELEE